MDAKRARIIDKLHAKEIKNDYDCLLNLMKLLLTAPHFDATIDCSKTIMRLSERMCTEDVDRAIQTVERWRRIHKL
jgi:hypothetical protein